MLTLHPYCHPSWLTFTMEGMGWQLHRSRQMGPRTRQLSGSRGAHEEPGTEDGFLHGAGQEARHYASIVPQANYPQHGPACTYAGVHTTLLHKDTGDKQH